MQCKIIRVDTWIIKRTRGSEIELSSLRRRLRRLFGEKIAEPLAGELLIKAVI